MSSDLETAKQLLALAQRFLDRGDLAKAAHAITQAQEIVTVAALREVLGNRRASGACNQSAPITARHDDTGHHDGLNRCNGFNHLIPDDTGRHGRERVRIPVALPLLSFSLRDCLNFPGRSASPCLTVDTPTFAQILSAARLPGSSALGCDIACSKDVAPEPWIGVPWPVQGDQNGNPS